MSNKETKILSYQDRSSIFLTLENQEILIPCELIILILSFLDVASLVSMSYVNKYFSLVTNEASLWERLLLEDFIYDIPSPHLINMNDHPKKKYISLVNFYAQGYTKLEHTKIEHRLTKQEIALLRATKNFMQHTFVRIFKKYCKDEADIIRLMKLRDRLGLTIFHWAGRLRNQAVLDTLFSSYLTFWQSNNGKRQLLGNNKRVLMAIATICNQTDYITTHCLPDPLFSSSWQHLMRAACAYNAYEVFKIFLKEAPWSEAEPIFWATCLKKATKSGGDPLTQQLLKMGADPIQKAQPRSTNKTPLKAALFRHNVAMVIAMAPKATEEMLVEALQSANLKLIEYLLASGIKANFLLAQDLLIVIVDPIKKQLILNCIYAAVSSYYRVNNNIDTQKTDTYGNTLLHWQAYCNIDSNLKCNKQLINQVNAKNYTPLHLAACQGHIKVSKRLLAKGADQNIMWQGLTPLTIAMKYRQVLLVAYYLTLPDQNQDVAVDIDNNIKNLIQLFKTFPPTYTELYESLINMPVHKRIKYFLQNSTPPFLCNIVDSISYGLNKFGIYTTSLEFGRTIKEKLITLVNNEENEANCINLLEFYFFDMVSSNDYGQTCQLVAFLLKALNKDRDLTYTHEPQELNKDLSAKFQ